MNNNDKQKLLKKLKAYEQSHVRFNFRDDDNTRYYDGIAVTVKKDDFKKLYDHAGINLNKITDSYKDYEALIRILKSYNIPYEDHFYEIKW